MGAGVKMWNPEKEQSWKRLPVVEELEEFVKSDSKNQTPVRYTLKVNIYKML